MPELAPCQVDSVPLANACRIPANDGLERDTRGLPVQLVGRPTRQPVARDRRGALLLLTSTTCEY
jgi:hypothetical protein